MKSYRMGRIGAVAPQDDLEEKMLRAIQLAMVALKFDPDAPPPEQYTDVQAAAIELLGDALHATGLYSKNPLNVENAFLEDVRVCRHCEAPIRSLEETLERLPSPERKRMLMLLEGFCSRGCKDGYWR